MVNRQLYGTIPPLKTVVTQPRMASFQVTKILVVIKTRTTVRARFPETMKPDLLSVEIGSTYAYWSPDILDYNSAKKNNRFLPDPKNGNFRTWCVSKPGDTRFAQTQTNMDTPFVMLCPSAFTGEAAPWETLDDVLADPSSNKVQKELDDMAPRAVTLMHELVHLIEGPDETEDIASRLVASEISTRCTNLSSISESVEVSRPNPRRKLGSGID